MYQKNRRYTAISIALFVVSVGFAAIAFLAFFYIGISYINDQGNMVQLAADLYSFIKIGAIGFVCFFVSYLLLLGAILVEHA